MMKEVEKTQRLSTLPSQKHRCDAGTQGSEDHLAEIRSLYRQSLQVGPYSALFRKFILEKLDQADLDPCAPPFDSLQTYAFKGLGSLASSLSSLGSTDTDQDENFDYLNELGPRFIRLACMFGSAVHSNN